MQIYSKKCAKPITIVLLLIAEVFFVNQVSGADIRTDYDWNQVRLGAGGWVTGMVMHPLDDNLVYVRTDVGGVYKYNQASGEWDQIILANAMPTEVIDAAPGLYKGQGTSQINAYRIESLALDPNDTQVLYVAMGQSTRSWLLKSSDQGSTFVDTGLTGVAMYGNGVARQQGERLVVDPNDSDIVLFGSRAAGLWRSPDAGATWQQIAESQLPFGAATSGDPIGINIVVFDAANTDRVFASVYGQGIYESNDSGLTWSPILTGFHAEDMECAGGVLYVASPSSGFGGIRKY